VDFPEKLDVIVVGGGPIGGITASGLVSKGLRTLVLEEHDSIGKPDHCAGLISLDGLRRLRIAPSKGTILNKVRGAAVFSASGTQVTVERQNDQAYVVDRVLLDRQIVNEATKEGASLAFNTRATSLEIRREAAFVTVDVGGAKGSKRKAIIRSDLVASCEGALAGLSKKVGLDTPNPQMRLYATQFEMSNVNLERQDIVQIHLGRNFALGFFAWVIPTGSDSARVGLGSKVPRTMSSLKYFVSSHRPTLEVFKRAKIDRIYGGIILTGGPTRKTYSDRFLAIGDCAGQTKPTTGGGVVTGGTCGKIAARVLRDSAEIGDFSERALRRYQEMWRRELGGEFFTMLQARRVLNCLPDTFIDRLISGASKTGLASLMEKQGNIDNQSNAIRNVLTHPKIMVGALLSLLGLF
jgi:digeranylgeranylglycerophospholipid reductase